MSSQIDDGPRNAFAADFLARLDELGEPDGAHEADVAGPWSVQPVAYRGGGGFALLREWESLDAGDVPYAVFRRRELALLAAAVLPATGREPPFRLAGEPDDQGFPLLDAGGSSTARGPGSAAAPPTAPTPPIDPIGHLRDFDQELAEALRIAVILARSPMALARLLEAAGHVALEQAGRILDRHVYRSVQ
jgi:hypothetical protein